MAGDLRGQIVRVRGAFVAGWIGMRDDPTLRVVPAAASAATNDEARTREIIEDIMDQRTRSAEASAER